MSGGTLVVMMEVRPMCREVVDFKKELPEEFRVLQ